MENNPCPICKKSAKIHREPIKDIAYVECPKCGNYEYQVITSLIIDLDSDYKSRTILSYWIHNHQINGYLKLNPKLIEKVLHETVLPKPKEQADNFIQWIGNRTKEYGKPIQVEYSLLESVIGATCEREVMYILEYVVENRLAHNTFDSSMNFDGYLTFDGWERYDELQRSNKDSKLAFMAMKFGNPILDRVFIDIIKKAVYDTGFEIRKLNEEHRAGSIDDKLRVEIRRSRFLISDLTDDNNGAYWEAGFAEGLGMPVIYICEESHFDKRKIHFDVNHHLILKWKDDEESLKQFAENLKATIRETLVGEAKMED